MQKIIKFSFLKLLVFVITLVLSDCCAAPGDFDKTFAGIGYVLANDLGGAGNDEWRSVAIQSDGKIIVAGSANSGAKAIIARYTSTGVLDTTFGGGGFVLANDLGGAGNDEWRSVALQSDGKIVV